MSASEQKQKISLEILKKFFKKLFRKRPINFNIEKYKDRGFRIKLILYAYICFVCFSLIFGFLVLKADMSEENKLRYDNIMNNFLQQNGDPSVKGIPFEFDEDEISFTLDKRFIKIEYYKYYLSENKGYIREIDTSIILLAVFYSIVTTVGLFIGINLIWYLLHLITKENERIKVVK